MDWLWPELLFLLGLIPLLIAAYIWVLRRRRRFAVRYSSLALVREALPRRSRLRRHIPFVLFLAALASLVLALGRPVAIMSVPTNQTTIILTMDVSGSMRFNDVPPSRLAAAENAALSFIQRQSATTQIGLVAFSGFAELIQPPTTDQEALQSAVESLTTGRATAIGSGILRALDAIAEIDPNVAPSVPPGERPGLEPTPVPQGLYAPEIIVLLTDGVSNAGPLPLDAAQQAADRGVRVYTIGFGTEQGPAGFRGRDPYGGGGFGGGPGGQSPGFQGQGSGGFQGQGGYGGFRRGIDEATLKQIADETGGKYYAAESASELLDVFRSLPTYLIVKHETLELSVAFAAVGMLLSMLAVTLSLIWHPML
jgi:Ca-activated chloride channel family protein